MKKLLILIILLLAPPVLAQQCSEPVEVARMSLPVMGGSVPVAAGCSTPATGDTMNSGWETGTYSDPASYGNGWTETIGAGGVADENFTLLGTPPGGSCIKGVRILVSETVTYIVWDNGSNIPVTSAIDTVFHIYLDSMTIGAFGKIRLLSIGNNANPAVGYNCFVDLFNWGGVYMLRAEGVSQATKATVTVDKWHTVKIHADPTAANSYIQVTGEGASTECDVEGECTFERYTNESRYWFWGGGSEVGAGEIVDMHIGYAYINTP